MAINGIFNVSDFTDKITRTFLHYDSSKRVDVGWPNLAELYKPEPGYMTVVTGIPGHGKSEVVDAILVNLAIKYGHRSLFFSPENFPLERHFIKLAEKFTGKPFRPSKYTSSEMSHEDLRDSIEWASSHFQWLYPSEEECRVECLLDKAQQVFDTTGINHFVIDPWNEVAHERPAALSETEYISQSLSKIRRFSRKNNVHTFIIAHPTKLQKKLDTGGYDPPTPYDISGSAHWRNKADFCITVYRANPNTNRATVIVQKVKFKDFGKVGSCELDYDFVTGRFKDTNYNAYAMPEPEV